MKERLEIMRGLEPGRNGDREGVADGSLDEAEARIVDLAGAGRRVLYLGLPAARVARALQSRACDVVLVDPGGGDAARDRAVFCDRVISRPIGTDGLIAELRPGEFDAVVLDGAVATAEALSELVPAVEHALGPGGLVIVRPEPDAPAAGPRSVEAILAAAGFVVLSLAEALGDPADAMAADLLAGRSPASDRRPLFAAFQAPQDEHGLIKDRLQALALAGDAASEGRAGLEEQLRESEAIRKAIERERDIAQADAAALRSESKRLSDRDEIARERDIAQADAAALRHSNQRLADRDEQLRELVLDAHEQLLQRDEELAAALARGAAPAAPAETGDGRFGYLRYREITTRVRALVDELVPADAVVAVACKGDDELLDLGGRTASHLPQTEDGVYLGAHPADGQVAVDQLEYVRAHGAEFFVLVGSVWWWLEHYGELTEHLERHYETVVREEGVCLIVDLRAPRPDPEVEPLERKRRDVVDRTRELVRDVVPEGAKVAVVTHGDDDLLSLDGRTGLHLPQGDGGVYAGYHPADSVTAVAQLEALREEGALYLVIPAPQLWWLDHYAEFAQHLAERYRLIARRAEAGVVYDLSGRPRLLSWRSRAR